MKKIYWCWNCLFLFTGMLIILTGSCKKGDDNNKQVIDIDGNVYQTVTIGTQVWMVENLNVTRYRNGDSIPNIRDSYHWNNINTGAYRDYNDDPVNSITYGRLYNFYNIRDSRQLCPAGWHVPTDEEWRILRELYGGINAGGSLKEAGTEHWQNPNTGATNVSGFTALPGGLYEVVYGNEFKGIEVVGIWWSSTEIKPYFAAFWGMLYNDHYMVSSNEGRVENTGLSIRLIKD